MAILDTCFSGISLSLYGQTGRERLFGALDRARKHGARIVFDTLQAFLAGAPVNVVR